MGRIARVIENIGNRVNMNLGGFFNNECDKVQPSGDDSRPLPKDDGYTEQRGDAGRFVVLGYFDYENKIAKPGEKRIYSREQSKGELTSYIHLKNDGTIEIANDGWLISYFPDGNKVEANENYLQTVAPDGTVDINGFIINPDGSASSPVSMTAPIVAAQSSLTKASVEVADQEHNHDAGSLRDGDNQQVTGATASSNG